MFEKSIRIDRIGWKFHLTPLYLDGSCSLQGWGLDGKHYVYADFVRHSFAFHQMDPLIEGITQNPPKLPPQWKRGSLDQNRAGVLFCIEEIAGRVVISITAPSGSGVVIEGHLAKTIQLLLLDWLGWDVLTRTSQEDANPVDPAS